MNWIQCLSKSIQYIEDHLTDRISIDEISNQAYTSNSHFQLIFHVVFGMTVGEYIRNRRLTSAAQDLLKPESKIMDVAMRYQYDTQESFSKAFTRFHGIPPSKVHPGMIKVFHPLTIHISVQGGFKMPHKLINEFFWTDLEEQKGKLLTDAEKYKRIVGWAGKARGHNPNVFDALTEWILDDSEWTAEKMAENEQILMQGIFARFKDQNAQLRAHLKDIGSSGVVNEAVYKALDNFDLALSGKTHFHDLRDVVSKMFADFTVMRDRSTRVQIAGGKTGPTGTNSVDVFGYINMLKEYDAAVQWALFMPDVVERQQQGFKVERFEYMKMPAMRFIGRERREGDGLDTVEGLRKLFGIFDTMSECKSGLDFDVLLQHHYGKGVDAHRCHGFWGRFMKADAPVPEGFIYSEMPIPQQGLHSFHSLHLPCFRAIWKRCIKEKDMTSTPCMTSLGTSCLDRALRSHIRINIGQRKFFLTGAITAVPLICSAPLLRIIMRNEHDHGTRHSTPETALSASFFLYEIELDLKKAWC